MTYTHASIHLLLQCCTDAHEFSSMVLDSWGMVLSVGFLLAHLATSSIKHLLNTHRGLIIRDDALIFPLLLEKLMFLP